MCGKLRYVNTFGRYCILMHMHPYTFPSLYILPYFLLRQLLSHHEVPWHPRCLWQVCCCGNGLWWLCVGHPEPPVARTRRRPVPAFPTEFSPCLLSPSPTVDTKHRTLHTHGPRSCSIGHNVAKCFATEKSVTSLFLKCFLPTQRALIGERV